MVEYNHNKSKGENKMDMTIPSIILFIAITIGLLLMPKIWRDFWAEIKDIYNIK